MTTRPLTKAEQKEAARLEAQLHAEGLAAGEFDHEVSRPPVPDARAKHTPADKAAYTAQAQAFLEDHAFANDFERRCWELHVQGLSNRKIVVLVRGSYRKKVQLTIARLARLMRAQIERKRRGRPGEGGYGGEAVHVHVRFNAIDMGAVQHVQEMAKARGMEVPTVADIVRVAVRAFARGA